MTKNRPPPPHNNIYSICEREKKNSPDFQPIIYPEQLSWAESRQIIFKIFHNSHFPTAAPSKAYKNQGQLQMFIMRIDSVIWLFESFDQLINGSSSKQIMKSISEM